MPTLRIALRNYADFEHALGEQAQLFTAAHPEVRMELVPLGIRALHRQSITDGGLRSGQFDLALMVTDWLAEALATRSLEDLNPWQAREPIPDWPSAWPRSLTAPLLLGSTLAALPWHDGPECLVYRSDLFTDPERRATFRAEFGRALTPPSTWQEFEDTARFLTDPSQSLHGTVFAAFPDGHNTLYDFALQVWSRGGELFDAAGVPQLTAPVVVDALNFYRGIVRNSALCHPRSPQLDSTQSGDCFLAGEVAMMVNWFGFAARACRAHAPLAGRVAIAPLPSVGGVAPVSLSVFWALAMGTGSRNKDLAWRFLAFVTSPERDLAVTRHGVVGTRLSTWRNPALQAEIPVYRALEQISLGARTLPSGPAMASFASIVDQLIARALTTVDPSATILEAAQQEAQRQKIRFYE